MIYCYLLILIITLSYLFYYHLSSSAECFVSIRHRPLASAADTSVDQCCTPSYQCLRLPWPTILGAGVCWLCPSSTSFAPLPSPLHWRRQCNNCALPNCSLSPPPCCTAPRSASSCPPLLEWLPLLQSHPLEWLIVLCFYHHWLF